ncbi:MAG TPA: S8 family serine peptidase, partial [Ignavibacteria bacterium]|nr:S8 family serine peptidase [Ignavibacteria bacterium]
MKNVTGFFAIVLLLIISNPLQLLSKDHFIYYQGSRLYMNEVDNFIAIKFKDNTPVSEMNRVNDIISPLVKKRNDFTASSKMNNFYSVSVVELKDKAMESPFAVDNIRQTLQVNSNVQYIGSAYQYNDMVLHLSLGEIIVKFKKNVSRFDIDNLNRLYNSAIIEQVTGFENTYLISIDPNSADDVFDLSNRYAVTQFVEFAHPNFIRSGMLLELKNGHSSGEHVQAHQNDAMIPNDTLNPRMWNLNNTGNNIPQNVEGTPGCDMKMFSAWDITTGNPNVMIAIVDTGIDTNHFDLRPNLCDRNLWYDAYDNDQKPYDEYYHGTGVSGITSAAGNNIAGMAGIAFSSQVMPVRVFGPAPAGFTTDLIL